jgi:hypothetical protein
MNSAYWHRAIRHPQGALRGAAKAVLSILAVPGFLFGLIVLAMIVFPPRWN